MKSYKITFAVKAEEEDMDEVKEQVEVFLEKLQNFGLVSDTSKVFIE